MNDAITIRDVTKRFNGVVAVDDLDLSVPRGSLYGFIGPNGSGKTTTLRMIMHILLPDSGEIEVLGERGTRAAHDRVSYLPEERGPLQADDACGGCSATTARSRGAAARARPRDRRAGWTAWGSRPGSTRRSRRSPRGWPRRSSSSPGCSTGPSS